MVDRFRICGWVAASVYAPVFLERGGAFDAIRRISVLALQGIAIVPVSVVRRGAAKERCSGGRLGDCSDRDLGRFAALGAAWLNMACTGFLPACVLFLLGKCPKHHCSWHCVAFRREVRLSTVFRPTAEGLLQILRHDLAVFQRQRDLAFLSRRAGSRYFATPAAWPGCRPYRRQLFRPEPWRSGAGHACVFATSFRKTLSSSTVGPMPLGGGVGFSTLGA